MRAFFVRLVGLTSALVLASACDALFGITQGVGNGGSGGSGGSTSASTGAATATTSTTGPSSTSGTAGTGGSGGSGSTGGTGGSGDGGTCTAGKATCAGSVLTLCDGMGHPMAPITCAAPSLCDPTAQKCSDLGSLSVGALRACAIEDTDQSVLCWGANYGDPQDGGSLLLGDKHFMFPSAVKIPGVTARQIAVADYYQCFLHDDGHVGCWGDDSRGTLGVLPTQSIRMIDPVPTLTDVVEIGAASSCACARLQTGEVDCWGLQDYGCLGTGGAVMGPQVPTKVPLSDPAVQLAVGDGGYTPVCARLVTGHVVCWGQDILPTEIPGITGALDVVVANDLVVIRNAAGLFWSTLVAPAADAGAPDGGPSAFTWAPATTPYPGFGTVTVMGAGYAVCAAQTDGSVQCAPSAGEPNNPPAGPSPVTVTGAVAEIRVGYGLTYGGAVQCLRYAGKPVSTGVYCWGDDGYGALGGGGPEYQTTKVDVPSFSTFPVTSLTTGSSSTSVVLTDGSAWFWGHSGTFEDMWPGVPAPTPLLNLSKNNTTIHSSDYFGEGYATKSGTTPVSLFESATAELGTQRLQTFTPASFTDARRGYVDIGLLLPGAPGNGQVVVFCDNSSGNGNACGLFGDGTNNVRAAAQAVPGLSATAIAYQDFGACDSHACAILPSGALQCWGNNNSGETGYAGTPPMDPPPSPVLGPTTVAIAGVTKPIVSVAVGHRFTCATDGLAGTGQVYCWGANNYGQLGNGFAFDYASPLPLPVVNINNGTGTSPAIGVTAFDEMACAWLHDGTVVCWGNNDFGQIGNGTFDVQVTPAVVKGLTGAAWVTAGPDFACAFNTAGTVVSCWGSSYWGQGGAGRYGIYPAPGQVMGL